jgi:DNA-directed RNA polymerase specialized sigma24 family protein
MSLSSFLNSTKDEELYSSNHPGDFAVFGERFLRCCSLLRFLACRVLGTDEGAKDAVENCWTRASRNPPDFEYEGAFRSWVARILIDEALAILRQRNAALTELSK